MLEDEYRKARVEFAEALNAFMTSLRRLERGDGHGRMTGVLRVRVLVDVHTDNFDDLAKMFSRPIHKEWKIDTDRRRPECTRSIDQSFVGGYYGAPVNGSVYLSEHSYWPKLEDSKNEIEQLLEMQVVEMRAALGEGSD